tara:strand:- start:43 stop:219 length:177 start_codon:yes stop_codon:yes gene_type:complete
MLAYLIVLGVIAAVLIAMWKGTRATDPISFSTKCPECGFHKGILKCIHCEDRKRDNWR